MEPSVPLHGRTRLGDVFNEDVTELQFLNSKPTCFVIFGKPGSGKTAIAKRLSEVWRCELVHGTDVIQREIDMGTDIGLKMQEVLMKGEALSTDFMVELLKEKVASPEVAHYGYILDGLPALSDQGNSVQEQIDIIRNFQLKPDFIINIKIPDIDLNTRRSGTRVDCQTGDEYLRNIWDPPPKPQAEKPPSGDEDAHEEEEEADEEEEGEELPSSLDINELDSQTKERLIHSPEHQENEVEKTSQLYKDISLKLLEDYMADHDRQYLIELDGNTPIDVMFQQLMTKLDSFTARHAVVPIRLQNQEEEELPDEIETEELLRTLASYQMPGPRCRWRRSKWGRFCPVALKKGNMIQGKPDLAVSFLDKIYVLSSPEAMREFLRNPRPFLLPPMPAPPCKLIVFGMPFSGKTTLCKVLAEKYKAKVFDMKELMKSQFEETRLSSVEKARQEAVDYAITVVRNKLEQEAIERAEERRKETQNLLVQQQSTTDEPAQDEVSEAPTDSINTSIAPADESISDTIDNQESSPLPPVTEEHEEVQKLVSEAVRTAEKQEIRLPAEAYASTLKKALDEMVEERLALDKDAPKDGGWILDGFPENKDHWAAMADVGIVPDEFVYLADKTQTFDVIRQRYFEANREEIIEEYRNRLISEKRDAAKGVEEEIKKALEASSEPTEEGSISEETDKDAKSENATSPLLAESRRAAEETERYNKLLSEIAELEESYLGIPAYDAQEFSAFREQCRTFEKDWSSLHGTITGTGTNRPIYIDINDNTLENISENVNMAIESSFGYRAWDFTGVDLDEEEEDDNADDDQEEEGEDEDERMNKKKQFGYSKHFDPVALKEDFVLWPGNPDIAAKYREKVYYFRSTDAREQFVENPTSFLPEHNPLTPPPPRILILGARGSGKTLQGRQLAKELGVFHISFRERLQELILPKTNMKLGPEHEESRLLAKELSVSVEEAVRRAIEEDPESAKKDEDQDEEMKFDLNDEEDAIRFNLVEEEPLPVEVLQKIIPGWWKEEPYRSSGFVLEGFPRTVEECQFLVQSGLFPDAALLLMAEDVDVIERLLPPRMEQWKKRRAAQDEKKMSIRQKKKEIRDAKIEERRTELLKEREKRLQEAGSDDEDEEEEDIEEILLAEFEDEEEEEDEEEQEEDASDRMKTEFGENFDDDVGKLQAVQEQLEEGAIPRLEVQASRKPSIVKYLIDIKLKPFIQFRNSLFERTVPVSIDVANRILMSGYKHPSSFTRWDPVKLLDDGEVIQPVRGMMNPIYPVVYNQYVYYLSSLESRNKFIANPTRYVFNQPLAKPVVPFQLAVVGPPKSGKTTLCERFHKEFGVVRLSIGGCARKILEEQPNTHLASQILSYLHQGDVLPDTLAVEALAVNLLDTTCTTRGYVLDGYPCTVQQMDILQKRGILPVKIIELDIDGKEALDRAVKEEVDATWQYPPHNSEDILVMRFAGYQEHIPPVRDFYTERHQNWMPLNGKVSKWRLWKTVLEEATGSVRKVQDYLDRIARGEAARLADLCISPSEFEAHLGSYGHYCPVSLNIRGELMDCYDKSYLQYAVEYRSKYYKTSSPEDMEAFLANPEKFVPPLAERELPEDDMLPKRRSRDEVKAMFPTQVELGGYCPVTFHDGKLEFKALVEGDPDYMAEYKGKLYSFKGEEELDKFMKVPERYCDFKLPHKLPPKRQPMDISALPMLGYLEQGAANSIIKALTAVGCFKPKFPFFSVKKSAVFYVACHLKAFNPRNNSFIRRKYFRKLQDFEEMCKIITYLGDNMPRKYHAPSSRPIDFDHKMEMFLGLESNGPSRNWMKTA